MKSKLYYMTGRCYSTDLHVIEVRPEEFELVICEGNTNKLERLSDIRHEWMENNGYKRAAAVNMQFFWVNSLGLQYRDSGILANKGSKNDEFLELIFENNNLIIDDITGNELVKYPNAKWAASVGFQLIKDGKINLRYADKFEHSNYKHPRTAIGQMSNGNIVLLATDGRTGSDSGLTAKQLADVMLDLKCEIAISFDGGGSTTMCINNPDNFKDYKVINKLAGDYQRPIGSALMLYCKDFFIQTKSLYYKLHIPKDTKKRRLGNELNVKYITVHSTANKKSNARDERNWLVNPSNLREYAGFHIVVDENEAVEAIPLNEIAIHAEDDLNGVGNNYSLGIEICESSNRQKTLNNAAILIAELLDKYNLDITNVKRHQHWKPSKNCPRILQEEDWERFLDIVESYRYVKTSSEIDIDEKKIIELTKKLENYNNIFDNIEKKTCELLDIINDVKPGGAPNANR